MAPAGRRAAAGSSQGPAAEDSRPLAERLFEISIVLLLILVPLVLIPGLRDPFRLPKQLLAELLALVSLGCLLLLPAERLVHCLRRCRTAALAVGPMWMCAALSTWHSERSELAAAGLWSFSVGAAALVAWSAGLTRPARVTGWLMWPAGAIAVLAVLESLGWFDPVSAVATSRRLALTATVGNPGDLAVFLLIPALLAQQRLAAGLGLAASPSSTRAERDSSRSGSDALFWTGIAALLGVAVLLTQTLAAILALGAGTVLFWGLALASSELERTTVKRLATLATVIVVIVVVAAASVGALRERVVTKVGQVASGDLNSALTGRLDGWRAALWMMEQDPVLGVGLGAYGVTYTTAKEALMAEGVPFFEHHGPFSSFANAHSEIFEVAAELGIVGLAALAWGVWLLVRRLRQRWHESSRSSSRLETAFLVAGVVTLLVDAVFYFPMRAALTAYPMVLLLAWVLRDDDAGSDTRSNSRESNTEAVGGATVRT